jgi:hypothetical protein
MISKREVSARRLVPLLNGLTDEEFELMRLAEESIDSYIEMSHGNMHIIPKCRVYDHLTGKDSEVSRKIILALLTKYEVAGWKIGIKDDALILE